VSRAVAKEEGTVAGTGEEHYSANLARKSAILRRVISEASSPKESNGRTEVSYPGPLEWVADV